MRAMVTSKKAVFGVNRRLIVGVEECTFLSMLSEQPAAV